MPFRSSIRQVDTPRGELKQLLLFFPLFWCPLARCMIQARSATPLEDGGRYPEANGKQTIYSPG